MTASATEVRLADMTTLGVGGPARAVDVRDVATLTSVVRGHEGPLVVVGGGSNLLVSDAGFDGLIVRPRLDGIAVAARQDDVVRVRVGAGVVWDDFVAWTTSKGLAGVECMSGIPGWVGAAPIQNIGAYGQEVRETIETVDVVERESGRSLRLSAGECGFGYRASHFKGDWAGRYVVVGVTFALHPDGPPAIRYGQLAACFPNVDNPGLGLVRDAVLRLRRAKSMVYDPADANHRSAGSFFMNPVLDDAALAALLELTGPEVPHYPGEVGTKVAAAWLIEQAGFNKGFRQGRAGLSTNHTLALTNRGGATADELLALARTIRNGVYERFGVWLWPEPVFLGFDAPVAELLA